ncbi:CD48 antigen [Equus quagga]|uniref:CD48 antigen n=1 Tax=Equus quagga TaxID=89248 RepID=UPI001EE23DA3|nr:CD48 antigen [Equus quagga]
MCSRRREWCLALELLLLPHWFLATSIQGHSESPVNALSGRNVRLQISNLPDKYKKLTWFYTPEQKIVEYEESSEPNYFKSKFKDKVKLDLTNGALDIHNVQKEDSSTYLLRVVKVTGNEEEWRVPLKVFDPVPKPVIDIKIQKMNNSCYYLTISCVVPDQSVNYSWRGDSGPLPKELQTSVFNVTIGPQNYSKFYTCEVSNPVSNSSSTVPVTLPHDSAGSFRVAWTAVWLVVIVPTVSGLLWN